MSPTDVRSQSCWCMVSHLQGSLSFLAICFYLYCHDIIETAVKFWIQSRTCFVLFYFPVGTPKVMKNADFGGEGGRGTKSLPRPNLLASPLKLRATAAVEKCNCPFYMWLNIVKYQVLSSRGQLNLISFHSAYMHRGSLSPLSSGFFNLKRNKSTLCSISRFDSIFIGF